jgi:parallel beta-helix repeat protein
LVAAGTNDNVIEDNTVLGNTNGIILVPGVEGNIVRHNVVVGNPPVQVLVTFPSDGASTFAIWPRPAPIRYTTISA